MATNKNEIINSLVTDMGMTVEEAELEYAAQFESTSGQAPKIPFPLAKFNNTAGIAPMGALVYGTIRDEDGEVTGFENVYTASEIDFIIFSKHAMYNHYDAMESKVTAKTCFGDVYQSATKFIDVISGLPLEKIVDNKGKKLTIVKDNPDLDMKYQVLALVGIKPKGSNEPLTFVNVYLKGALLYGINKVADGVDSSRVLLNLVTETARMGSVKYTSIDLNHSEAYALPNEVFTANLVETLKANKAQREYVEAINAFYINGSDHKVEPEDGLPA